MEFRRKEHPGLKEVPVLGCSVKAEIQCITLWEPAGRATVTQCPQGIKELHKGYFPARRKDVRTAKP